MTHGMPSLEKKIIRSETALELDTTQTQKDPRATHIHTSIQLEQLIHSKTIEWAITDDWTDQHIELSQQARVVPLVRRLGRSLGHVIRHHIESGTEGGGDVSEFDVLAKHVHAP